ncbi:hypothetical protein ABZ078_32575 [Streptomyces sp. NPDC006385]
MKHTLGCLLWSLAIVHSAGGHHDAAEEANDDQCVRAHRDE